MLALSIGGAVFVNRTLIGLPGLLPKMPSKQLQLIIAGSSSSFSTTHSSHTREHALEIIINALSKTFVLVYVAGALGLNCSVLLTNKKLNMQASAAK